MSKIIICSNCGYPEGLHHAETGQCPADDPYMPVVGDREWADTVFVKEPK